MIYLTYPVVRDSRLLVGIAENIFLAFANTLSFALERKTTPPKTFEAKLSAYSRYYPTDGNIEVMRELKEIILCHKKSQMEFSRRDSFVICDSAYATKTLTLESNKRFLASAKQFFKMADRGDLNESK